MSRVEDLARRVAARVQSERGALDLGDPLRLLVYVLVFVILIVLLFKVLDRV